MTIEGFIAVVIGLLSISSSLVIGIKWLVKHYLAELKPNGGTSIKDQVNRLEQKVDRLYEIVLEVNTRRRRQK